MSRRPRATAYFPGLMPRPHAGSAAEFLARYDREAKGENGAKGSAAAPLEEWRHLARRLLHQPSPGGGDPSSNGGRSPAASASQSASRTELAGGNSGDVAPGARRHLERLAAARLDVDAFEPVNRQQRELVGLLRATLTFMEGRLHRRGGCQAVERWWQIFLAYRRALSFPELTGPRRRAALEKLLGLKEAGLFAVARKGRLGRRMPDRKTTRRRGPRCAKR